MILINRTRIINWANTLKNRNKYSNWTWGIFKANDLPYHRVKFTNVVTGVSYELRLPKNEYGKTIPTNKIIKARIRYSIDNYFDGDILRD